MLHSEYLENRLNLSVTQSLNDLIEIFVTKKKKIIDFNIWYIVVRWQMVNITSGDVMTA